MYQAEPLQSWQQEGDRSMAILSEPAETRSTSVTVCVVWAGGYGYSFGNWK